LNLSHYNENLEINEQKLFYAFSNNIGNFSVENDNQISDPLFADFANQHYNLALDSPCINAGMSIENFVFPTFDLVGNDRISDFSIDIGAYEFQADSFSPEKISSLSVSAMQIYPNPFNPQTKISFTLYESSHVRLAVYNMKGQKITTLLDTNLTQGEHAISWNGKNDKKEEIASGIYLIQLKMNDVPVSYSKGILLK
jgi:hypothetical protein